MSHTCWADGVPLENLPADCPDTVIAGLVDTLVVQWRTHRGKAVQKLTAADHRMKAAYDKRAPPEVE